MIELRQSILLSCLQHMGHEDERIRLPEEQPDPLPQLLKPLVRTCSVMLSGIALRPISTHLSCNLILSLTGVSGFEVALGQDPRRT